MIFAVAVFVSFVYLIANGALDWGPLKRAQPVADASVAPTRTTAHHRSAGSASRAAAGRAAEPAEDGRA